MTFLIRIAALFVVNHLLINVALSQQKKIDRYKLVERHNIVLTEPDTLAALSVGNGEFAFTADISGLQTFNKEYENGISLGTMSQWAWHSIPKKSNYKLEDVHASYTSCDSTKVLYPIQHKQGYAAQATDALRANPHRLHLGLVGLHILKKNGQKVNISDLQNVRQSLDLWRGKLETEYIIEGEPVQVILFAHPEKDQISVRIQSALIKKKRLSVDLRFPYGKECHTCAGYDFDQPNLHRSDMVLHQRNTAVIYRTLDTTRYVTNVSWNGAAMIKKLAEHHFRLDGSASYLEFSVLFSRVEDVPATYAETRNNSSSHWKTFWSTGGAVDFSACTDERAFELERRVVLSQYLTRIQCAGTLPPQETGLTMNSWFGKFHMEMYWWHTAHFPLWGRKEHLERSFHWYQDVHAKARQTAKFQGYHGARWQKMTDPYGDESPSSIGPFLVWQQPHPIYLAELLYRAQPDKDVLKKYSEVVFSTADFMRSFLKEKNGSLHLCRPVIPAQEIFPAAKTDDPTFELQYWHYALSIEQKWRMRLGLSPDSSSGDILRAIAALPHKDRLYLPNATTPTAYVDSQYRHDHPAVLGALGFLPHNARVDTVIMLNTLREIMTHWNWESTWGWDYPLVAMNATRLHQPDIAIKAIMMNTEKNTYLKNGHNYQDKRLRLYLPGNGGLLTAIALMCAGWDGNTAENPGFPKDGKWNVRWENINRMP